MIVSAMLSFIGISGFLGKINLSNLDVDITLPKEVYAKESIPVKVFLKNKKRFIPSFLIRIKILDKVSFITLIDRKSSKSTYVYLSFNDRGISFIREIYICSIFPFNFFVRCKPYKVNKKIIVFPSPKNCKQVQKDYSGRKKAGNFSSNVKGYLGDILYIRDYNYADPIKYIHWKASAKTDTLKTKELSNDMSDPVIIDLDLFNGNIEQKISCATYLILKLYKRNIPFGLKLKNKLIKPEFSEKQKLRILRELALYGKS